MTSERNRPIAAEIHSLASTVPVTDSSYFSTAANVSELVCSQNGSNCRNMRSQNSPKLASDCEFTHQNFEKFFGKPTALRVQRQGKIVFKFWNFSRRLHHSCVWSWNGARRRRQFSDNYLCVCYKFERLLSRGVAFPVTKRFSWCVGVQKRWVFLF